MYVYIFIYIYIYTHTHTHTHSFLPIFHHVLSQEIRYSSLCCTVGLYLIFCIYQPQTPTPLHFLPLPLGNHRSVLYVCVSVSIL